MSRNGEQAREVDLREKHLDELREMARRQEISGASSMRKEELVSALTGTGQAGGDGGARRGTRESKSLTYAQEITSTDQEPERAGRGLVTTDHEVIRQWAEARGGVPATVAGSEHGDRAGVLRFDFDAPGEGASSDSRLRHISWEEWFETFDQRGLNFIYQERRADGRQSNFFRLENPGREDA